LWGEAASQPSGSSSSAASAVPVDREPRWLYSFSVLRNASSRRVLTVISMVAVLALAAACGSSSSSSPPASSGGGGSSSTPSTSTPATSSNGGGLSDSSFCGLAKKWKAQAPKEAAVLANFSSGPAGIKAFYTKLASQYQAVIAVAPSDIKPSMQVLYTDFLKLNSVLAKYHYDLKKAAPALAADAALFNSATAKAAIAKLDAWGKSNSCHL
jgi:ABC-type glycerol-3-phosphate transport system substrate-binding protein